MDLLISNESLISYLKFALVTVLNGKYDDFSKYRKTLKNSTESGNNIPHGDITEAFLSGPSWSRSTQWEHLWKAWELLTYTVKWITD